MDGRGKGGDFVVNNTSLEDSPTSGASFSRDDADASVLCSRSRVAG